MNLSRLDEEILQLINSYSTNGNLTTSSENADFLLRTRNLIDICQKELANLRKISADPYYVVLGSGVIHGDFSEVELPSNFKELKNIYLQNDHYIPLNNYIFEGNRLLVKSDLSGTLVINYYKKPTTITKDTDANAELEIDEDAQQLIPFYVGGWIFMMDNPTLGAMLVNEYKEKKDSLGSGAGPAAPVDIIDVYEEDLNNGNL